MPSILDRSFRYTPSHKTNVRATIARELRRLAEVKRQQEADAEAKRLAEEAAQRAVDEEAARVVSRRRIERAK